MDRIKLADCAWQLDPVGFVVKQFVATLYELDRHSTMTEDYFETRDGRVFLWVSLGEENQVSWPGIPLTRQQHDWLAKQAGCILEIDSPAQPQFYVSPAELAAYWESLKTQFDILPQRLPESE